MWGWNESGQLGLPCKSVQDEKEGQCKGVNKTVNIQLLPEVLDVTCAGQCVDVEDISGGSRHSAFVTGKGQKSDSPCNGELQKYEKNVKSVYLVCSNTGRRP